MVATADESLARLLSFALDQMRLPYRVVTSGKTALRELLDMPVGGTAPLVLVLLTFFCLGVAVGIIASLGHLFRQRRQIAALRGEVRAQSGAGGKAAGGTADTP